MILLVIIAGTSAFFALTTLPKITDKYARWITIALAVTTGFSLLPNPVLSYDGFVAHALSLFVAIVYIWFPRDVEFSFQKKAFMVICIGLPLLTNSLILYIPPGIPEMGYLCSASVICFAYVMFREKADYKNELGILIIAAADAFVRLGEGIPAVG